MEILNDECDDLINLKVRDQEQLVEDEMEIEKAKEEGKNWKKLKKQLEQKRKSVSPRGPRCKNIEYIYLLPWEGKSARKFLYYR